MCRAAGASAARARADVIPDPLAREVANELGAEITEAHALGGGCISNATRVRTMYGATAFLKWGRRRDFAPGIFACEAHALETLAVAKAVRVPKVVALRDDASAEYCWLLLEWLEPGRMQQKGWEALGRGLATLHRDRQDAFGWREPNFIGSLPQSNAWNSSWPKFWSTQRIAPQLEQAARSGLLTARDRKRIESLLQSVPALAAVGDQEGASLLHGDLWGGNVHALTTGEAALIDPSCYYGHREVDLAMATLFGGFDAGFFAAYEEAWPLREGYERRRLLYQLYYLLVHVNLFGGAYTAGTMGIVSKLGY